MAIVAVVAVVVAVFAVVAVIAVFLFPTAAEKVSPTRNGTLQLRQATKTPREAAG